MDQLLKHDFCHVYNLSMQISFDLCRISPNSKLFYIYQKTFPLASQSSFDFYLMTFVLYRVLWSWLKVWSQTLYIKAPRGAKNVLFKTARQKSFINNTLDFRKKHTIFTFICFLIYYQSSLRGFKMRFLQKTSEFMLKIVCFIGFTLVFRVFTLDFRPLTYDFRFLISKLSKGDTRFSNCSFF